MRYEKRKPESRDYIVCLFIFTEPLRSFHVFVQLFLKMRTIFFFFLKARVFKFTQCMCRVFLTKKNLLQISSQLARSTSLRYRLHGVWSFELSVPFPPTSAGASESHTLEAATAILPRLHIGRLHLRPPCSPSPIPSHPKSHVSDGRRLPTIPLPLLVLLPAQSPPCGHGRCGVILIHHQRLRLPPRRPFRSMAPPPLPAPPGAALPRHRHRRASTPH